MIHKSITPPLVNRSPLVRVTFELPSCTWACRIFVCGDFNDWSANSLQMRQDRDGVWRASIDLPPNQQFEFRYLIDGNWQTDYHADGWSDSGYGSENSIVDTSLLPELTPKELSDLAEPIAIDMPKFVRPQSSQTATRTYPTVSMIVEERATAAQRPVSQPAHAVKRVA